MIKYIKFAEKRIGFTIQLFLNKYLTNYWGLLRHSILFATLVRSVNAMPTVDQVSMVSAIASSISCNMYCMGVSKGCCRSPTSEIKASNSVFLSCRYCSEHVCPASMAVMLLLWSFDTKNSHTFFTKALTFLPNFFSFSLIFPQRLGSPDVNSSAVVSTSFRSFWRLRSRRGIPVLESSNFTISGISLLAQVQLLITESIFANYLSILFLQY